MLLNFEINFNVKYVKSKTPHPHKERIKCK
jgi:hypothetical protein